MITSSLKSNINNLRQLLSQMEYLCGEDLQLHYRRIWSGVVDVIHSLADEGYSLFRVSAGPLGGLDFWGDKYEYLIYVPSDLGMKVVYADSNGVDYVRFS